MSPALRAQEQPSQSDRFHHHGESVARCWSLRDEHNQQQHDAESHAAAPGLQGMEFSTALTSVSRETILLLVALET